MAAPQIVTRITSATKGVAQKLFPQAKRPLAALAAVAAILVVGAVMTRAFIFSNNELEYTTYWAGDEDPCEDVEEAPDCDAKSSGADALVKAAQKELSDWESGTSDYHRYKDQWDPLGADSQDGGWCGFFVKYIATQIGSSTGNGQGDAFPPDCTWPGSYIRYYTENPDKGEIIVNADGVKPEPGDIFVTGGDPNVQMTEEDGPRFGTHVGMVESVEEDGFWAIEGGGSVDHNKRGLGSNTDVTWFFRPNYDAIDQPTFQKNDSCKKDKGDIQIPETMEFINDKEHGSPLNAPDRISSKVGDIGSWEGNVNVPGGLRSLGLIGDVLKMADFYDANGGYTDPAGFERIKNVNDYYILAIGAYPYAAPGCEMVQIGDHLTLYYDDGTEVDALVGDWKGWDYTRNPELDPQQQSSWYYIEKEVDPQQRVGHGNGWGHGPFHEGASENDYSTYFENDGRWHCNVTEFWGSSSSGDPMYVDSSGSSALQRSTGGRMTRLVGVTNHGLCPEFASFGGGSTSGTMVDSAASSTRRQREKIKNDDMQDCSSEKDKKVDNSTLAAAMVSYSYSQSKLFNDSDGKTYPGTELYDKVWQATINDRYYRSCDRGVAAAVKWSGADDNFEYGGCESEHNYMAQATDLWKLVAEDVTLTGDDAGVIAQYGLQPGDVFCTKENRHTFAYVGEDIVKQVYESTIKGTDGDVGAPEPGTCWMTASIGSDGTESTRDAGPSNGKAPGLYAGASDARGPYDVFRYVGSYPDKDKYADVGTVASAKAQGKTAIPCECMEDDHCEEQVSAEKYAESAKAEVELHKRNPVGMKYQEALKDVARKKDPEGAEQDWGGQCSEFCLWNLMNIGFEPGKYLWDDSHLASFSYYPSFCDQNKIPYKLHDLTTTEPGYTPKVGDVAFQDHGAHFEIVTGVNASAGTWTTAASGGPEAVEHTFQLGDASATSIGDGYDVFFSFDWDAVNKMMQKDAGCKNVEDEETDDRYKGGKGTLTPEQRKKIVEFARTQIGVADYNFGPNGGMGGSCENDIPNQQLSCNGLTFHSYRAAGIDIPCDSYGQVTSAPTVTSTGTVSDMTAGDIIVFDNGRYNRPDVPNIRYWGYPHVAVYAGNGTMIESTFTRDGFHGVREVPIEDNGYSYSITW